MISIQIYFIFLDNYVINRNYRAETCSASEVFRLNDRFQCIFRTSLFGLLALAPIADIGCTATESKRQTELLKVIERGNAQ